MSKKGISCMMRSSASWVTVTWVPPCGLNDWQAGRHDWKHYHPRTLLAGGKKNSLGWFKLKRFGRLSRTPNMTTNYDTKLHFLRDCFGSFLSHEQLFYFEFRRDLFLRASCSFTCEWKHIIESLEMWYHLRCFIYGKRCFSSNLLLITGRIQV